MEAEYESNAYTGFALAYDQLMDNIPYDIWCEYLKNLLHKYGVKTGLIAELGCGTGNITKRLCNYGYDMIGIDNSEDMLAAAKEKITEERETSILYLLQDMRELELYGTVAAFISICDSMNYLLEEEDLLQVFRLVNNYLDPKGVFIFDLKTEAYFESLGENTIAENRQETSFIWENYYQKETGINQYDLTIYISEKMLEQEDGEEDNNNQPEAFYRFEETHYQRAYSLETIKELLKQSGMEFIAAYEAFTEQMPKRESERIYIIAREGHQENKHYIK